MDLECPDGEKDFPGLYGLGAPGKGQDRGNDCSDEEKVSRKELRIEKLNDQEKNDKGCIDFQGQSSEGECGEHKGKGKKSKAPIKPPGKGKTKKFLKCKEQKEGSSSKKGSDSGIKESKKTESRVNVCKKEPEQAVADDSHFVFRRKMVRKTCEASLSLSSWNTILSLGGGFCSLRAENPIFGVPLSVAVKRNPCHDGTELPLIVRECINYIEEHGLTCEGIYGLPGVKSKVQQLRASYNRQEPVCFSEHEPQVVASLLKQFLRELPEPVLTSELTSKFEAAAGIKDEVKCVKAVQNLLDQLPVPNRLLLSWVVVHMSNVISMERHNKLNLQNIFTVLGPSMQISHKVLNALFAHGNIFFKDVQLKKYVKQTHLDPSWQSLDLPETTAAVEAGLSHQEQVLSEVHAQPYAGLRDPQKEEQLWEVQHVVTQFKRKEEDVVGSGEMHATGDLKQEPPAKDDEDADVTDAVEAAFETGKEEAEQLPSAETKLFGVEEAVDMDTEVRRLRCEQQVLIFRQEGLLSLGDGLRRKIAAKKGEIERLRSEIAKYQELAKYEQYSPECAYHSKSGPESSKNEREEDLKKTISQLIKENDTLSKQAMDVSQRILEEREACIDIKVRMRALQTEASLSKA